MMAKRIVLTVTKVVAGVAAVVFWFAPVSRVLGMFLFIVAIIVLLICFVITTKLDEKHNGYWPDKPNL